MAAQVTVKLTVYQLDSVRAVLKRDRGYLMHECDIAREAHDQERLKELAREIYQLDDLVTVFS